MKKRSFVLLLCAMGFSFTGVATASAFLIKDAVQKTTTDQVDSVMYLKWGESSDFSAATGLNNLEPIYRTIVLEKPVVVGDTAAAIFTCTLNVADGKTMNGLTVDIARNDWAVEGTVAEVTLSNEGDHLTQEIDKSASSTTFYLRISITDEAYAGYQGNMESFGANLSLTYLRQVGGSN